MENTKQRFRSAISRALGFVDNNPLSITAGCADRNYWHYQDGKGFPVGSFQVVMFSMRAASRIFPESSQAYSAGADLAALWWAKQIQAKGALDEYFANQRSFCATAYTAMTAALWLKLPTAPSEEVTLEVSTSLASALRTLRQDKHRPDSANQSLAARLAWDIAASLNIVAGPSPFAPKELNDFGVSEYGGFDLGYSLKCLDLCALALLNLKDPVRRAPYIQYASNLIRTLHLLCVQFTFSPCLGARGNPHRLLGGLKIFAKLGNPAARELLESLQNLRRFPSLVNAESCDDKYLAFFHLNSLLLELHSESPVPDLFSEPAELPNFQVSIYPQGLHHIKELDLILYKAGSVRAAIALSQGGLVHSESPSKSISDLGYLFLEKNRLYTILSRSVELQVKRIADDKFLVSFPIRIHRLKQRALLTQNWLFSFSLKIALSLPMIGQWLRNRIYGSIKEHRHVQEVGERKILLTNLAIEINDHFTKSFQRKYPVHEWIFNDGHATRMFEYPKATIQTQGSLDAT